MRKWTGSAGICINQQQELLMVRSYESEEWAAPSGGMEVGESPEECCVREVKEETGYDVKIIERLKIKETIIKGIQVKTYYFKVENIGESSGVNDPDKIIAEADWKSSSDIKQINHAYPEDVEFLMGQLEREM